MLFSEIQFQVRAFNLFGPGPFSLVQYKRTLPKPRRNKKSRRVRVEAGNVLEKTPEDEDVTVYLIIGQCRKNGQRLIKTLP